MKPQRVSMLWQFASRSFLHSTSWNPFTHPGRMYLWIIIRLICEQSLSVFNKWKDKLHQHLRIWGVGNCTISPSTRELATIPRSNCLPSNSTRRELEWRSITKIGTRHGRILVSWWMVGGSGKASWWGFLLILRILITNSHWPISNSHVCLMACRHQQDYASELSVLGLRQFGHHHLSYIFYCPCQWFSHNPPLIRFYQMPELQLLMNSILLTESFVLTPTSFPAVYCSVCPLPLNHFPLFLANTYKHGPCTCTQGSISSVQPHPVFISFDIVRKAFLPYCVAD